MYFARECMVSNNIPQQKYSILLVDDEESILTIASSILELDGYDIKTALSVDEAIRMMKEYLPDIIISDVNMPGKTGFDFFQYVRSVNSFQDIPFIFMTGNSDIESIKMGKEIGSDDYLTKPVDYHVLLSTIKGKLKRKDSLRKSQASQIDEIKKHLFQLISHEIRTPLTSILGATELLSDPSQSLSQDELTSFLTMLQANSKRLTNMVDDFLLATRIESGEVKNEVSDLDTAWIPAGFVEKVIAGFHEKTANRQSAIINEVSATKIVSGIYLPHLEAILFRLIDNGIKFSSPEKTVTVRSEETNDTFTFIIQDEGCGIAKEQQALLFEKFQQLNRQKNEQQGTGMGLYIARKLTEVNNGKIWFESETGKGSSFFVQFRKGMNPAG